MKVLFAITLVVSPPNLGVWLSCGSCLPTSPTPQGEAGSLRRPAALQSHPHPSLRVGPLSAQPQQSSVRDGELGVRSRSQHRRLPEGRSRPERGHIRLPTVPRGDPDSRLLEVRGG